MSLTQKSGKKGRFAKFFKCNSGDTPCQLKNVTSGTFVQNVHNFMIVAHMSMQRIMQKVSAGPPATARYERAGYAD